MCQSTSEPAPPTMPYSPARRAATDDGDVATGRARRQAHAGFATVARAPGDGVLQIEDRDRRAAERGLDAGAFALQPGRSKARRELRQRIAPANDLVRAG